MLTDSWLLFFCIFSKDNIIANFDTEQNKGGKRFRNAEKLQKLLSTKKKVQQRSNSAFVIDNAIPEEEESMLATCMLSSSSEFLLIITVSASVNFIA